MISIAIIDDDPALDILVENLSIRGHNAYRIGSANTALQEIDRIVSADLVVLDVIMPWPEGLPTSDLAGVRSAGMEVLKEIRMRKPDLPVIVHSAIQDNTIIDALGDDVHTAFSPKWESPSLKDFIKTIYSLLGFEEKPEDLHSFIVHGHDEITKLALKNYLQNTLKLSEPIILHEQPNCGRTIIEKFEDYAAMSSIVFVLLTPDDTASTVGEDDDKKRRARQNVIFEMGYFLGMLGRKSGRVLLLYISPLELPSDLSGIVYIDISSGIESASDQIRKEIENVRN